MIDPTFAHALQLETDASRGSHVWHVPDGWQQGRGAFGGLTIAALARAAAVGVDVVDCPLRTITAEIPAAVLVGPAHLQVTPLRDGHSLRTRAVDLVQGEAIAAHAVLNFGRTRDVGFDRVPAASGLPRFADAAETPRDPQGPTFTEHFEYRIVRGFPLSGDPDAVAEGWVRLRHPGDVPPWLALLAMIDAWFPTLVPVFHEPRPFGTISFAAHLFEQGWRPDRPLYHRARLLGAQNGYFAEQRELLTEDGALCALNQQTLAIIK